MVIYIIIDELYQTKVFSSLKALWQYIEEGGFLLYGNAQIAKMWMLKSMLADGCGDVFLYRFNSRFILRKSHLNN